jgi:hypothetical protein
VLALSLVLAVHLLAAADDLRDVVKLNGGASVRGRIVYRNDDKLIVRTGGRERTIAMKDVASFESVADSMEEYLERSRKLAVDDVAGHLDLASFCTDKKLSKQMAVEALHVLRVDPKNEQAHTMLGHRRSEGTWYVPLDGGEVSWALVDRTTSDWGKALRLETEHFAIRTNAGVAAAVDLACDVEALYSAFYQVFGADLEMREILEPIAVNAYRTQKDGPSAGSHVGGYFNGSDRTLYVFYREIPGRPFALFHEGTHAILVMGIEREQSGNVPSWVNEGMAEYFHNALQGPPGKAKLLFGAANIDSFHVVATSKPTGLQRILNYGATDFSASSGQRQKYDECYTLVHFLVHSNQEALRLKFADYLRGAFRSKATAGRFEKSMGQGLDAIEKAWRQYVAAAR